MKSENETKLTYVKNFKALRLNYCATESVIQSTL